MSLPSFARLASGFLGLLAATLAGPVLAQLPPAPSVRLAVNPITNKVYAADQQSNAVTVLDASTGTTRTIAVGNGPQFIAVDPFANRVYVDNARDATLSVIDGATDTNLTPTALAVGSEGPIAIDPATGIVYIVRLTGPGSDEVTFFDPAQGTWYTIATNSFQPIALAVNPVTDTIYVAHYATGDVRVISGAFDPNDTFPSSVSIGVFSHPVAVAANPVTNKVYAITEDSRGPIAVIDGATNAAVFPPPLAGHAQGPKSLAVNPVTNRVYAAFANEVIVIDGATNGYTYVPVDTGSGQVGLAVNATTNQVFVAADDGTLTVIDGDTNATRTIAIAVGANALGVNPVTDTAFAYGADITPIPAAPGDTVHPIPLTVSIGALPNDTSGPDASFTLTAASAFSPQAPAIEAVHYQLDSTGGPWLQASGTGPYTASFTRLAPGPHTLHAFAVDGQQAPRDTGPQSMPLVGAVASYAFTVAVPASVSLASSANPSVRGQPVTFTASVAATSGTPTGNVDFQDGGTSIAGCSAVALSSGSASCVASQLATGSHAVTAVYSGDSNFSGATSATLTQAVNPATPTVSLASSANPSTAGADVTFTATVSGGLGAASGTVDFLDASTVLSGCSGVALSSGAASCSTASLSAGSHSITARYSGDANYAASVSNVVSQSVQSPQSPPPPGAPAMSLSATALDFGGQSMGTTSPAQTIVVTNSGSAALAIGSIAVSDAQFAQSSDCASLDPGASCSIDVTFTPAAQAGAVDSTDAVSASLTISSNAATSPDAATLSGTAEKSLVTHFYLSILGREPDSTGKAFWEGEATRMVGLGANVNEAWYAMAAAFFSSPEYAARGRDDAGYVADLYETFFNRAPDSGGLSFWTGQLAGGMPRGVVLVSFMFSPEFQSFTQGIFGDTQARAEVDVVGDFYRGLLARLPDSSGFDFWVGQFRTAQCQGSGAVYAAVQSISSSFADGTEYAGRNRTNGEYVGDLYNAFLRRGGDSQGVQFWISQLDSGAQTRDQVRAAFIASPEFTDRVNAIVSQGCMP